MIFEPVSGSRFTEHLSGGETVIEIPVRRNWFVLLFVSFWLAMWSVGGMSAIGIFFVDMPDDAPRAFLLFWLCGWALGWLSAASTIAWQVFGREIVIASPVALTLKKRALVNLSNRSYSVADIQHLELFDAPESASWWPRGRTPGLYPFGTGAVGFDYGRRTVTFGVGLDKAEARRILEVLRRRIPSAFGSR